MDDIRDHEDTMSVSSMMTTTSAYTITRQDPGRIVTHQAAQEWSDPEMLRQCPFDPVHVVQAYRYQRHVLRCLKQNPEKARHFQQCKYNAMHFHKKIEIEQHEQECPDRNRAENIYRHNTPATRSITDKIYVAADWEEELQAGSNDMIRPTRENILELKKILRQKYSSNEKYRSNPFKKY